MSNTNAPGFPSQLNTNVPGADAEFTNDSDVILPITGEEFDELLAEVIDRYQVPAGDDVEEACATAIMHLPAGRAYVPISYFGNAARQALSKMVAYERLENFRKKRAAEQAAKNPPKSESAPGQPIQNAGVPAPVQGVESKASASGP